MVCKGLNWNKRKTTTTKNLIWLYLAAPGEQLEASHPIPVCPHLPHTPAAAPCPARSAHPLSREAKMRPDVPKCLQEQKGERGAQTKGSH